MESIRFQLGAGQRILAAALMSLAVPLGTLHAQSQRSLNPPYLSEMPAVQRVTAEIKGTDPMDTAARQMGAFWQFQEIINNLAGPRRYRNQLTPDEQRLLGEYRGGYASAAQPYGHIQNSPSHPDKPKWYKMHTFYEVDDGFLDELLNRFFSPAFRAEYLRVRGQLNARAVERSRAAANARAQSQAQQQGQSSSGTQQDAAKNTATPASGGVATPQPGAPGKTSAPPKPQPAPPAGSAEAFVAQGKQAFEAKDYAKAIEVYKKAIALKPSMAAAHYGLGMTYVALEKRTEAVAAAEKLEPLDEKLFDDLSSWITTIDPVFLTLVGNKYVNEKNYAKALSTFKDAVRLGPDWYKAWEGLGSTYFILEQYPDALKALQEAIRLKPDYADAHYGLGMTYLAMGNKPGALRVHRNLRTMNKELAQRLYDNINRMK